MSYYDEESNDDNECTECESFGTKEYIPESVGNVDQIKKAKLRDKYGMAIGIYEIFYGKTIPQINPKKIDRSNLTTSINDNKEKLKESPKENEFEYNKLRLQVFKEIFDNVYKEKSCRGQTNSNYYNQLYALNDNNGTRWEVTKILDIFQKGLYPDIEIKQFV